MENVFGIMSSVFRVLRKPMLLQPNKVAPVTMTCCFLHNVLLKSKTSRGIYTPTGTFDLEVEGNVVPGSSRMEQNDIASSQKLARKSALQSNPIDLASLTRARLPTTDGNSKKLDKSAQVAVHTTRYLPSTWQVPRSV